MKIRLFIALVLATTGLLLGYYNFIPEFISLGVCIISFFCALITIIKGYFDEVNNSRTRIHEGLNNMILTIQKKENDNISALIQVQSDCFEKLGTLLNENRTSLEGSFQQALGEFSRKATETNQSFEAIQKKNIESTGILSEKLDSLKSPLSDFATGCEGLSKNIDSIKQNVESFNRDVVELKDAQNNLSVEIKKVLENNQSLFEQLKGELEGILKQESAVIQQSNNSQAGIMTDFMNKCGNLCCGLDSYNKALDSLFGKFEDLKQTQEKLISGIGNLSKDNKIYLEDLKDQIETFLSDESEKFKGHSEDNSQKVSEITKAIKNMTSSVEGVVGRLGLDVQDLCDAVSAIDKKTQDIDSADKDLLDKISKLCE